MTPPSVTEAPNGALAPTAARSTLLELFTDTREDFTDVLRRRAVGWRFVLWAATQSPKQIPTERAVCTKPPSKGTVRNCPVAAISETLAICVPV